MFWQGKQNNLILTIRTSQLFNQFGRFVVVGILATLSHVGTLALLVEFFNCKVLIATTSGFIAAVLLSYILNYRWTFKAERGHHEHLPRYVVACISGFALNTMIMYVTVIQLQWWYLAGQFTALMIVPVNNFLLNRYWVFAESSLRPVKHKITYGCGTKCQH